MEEPATQEERDNLTSFAKAVWGNPQAMLKRDDCTGVEHIDLSGHVEAFKFLLGEAVLHDKILVREEYRIALQALETEATYRRGAYVTGQPGIGKRLFLVYVLVARLEKQQTVASQYTDGRPYCVMFRDEATIYPVYSMDFPEFKFGPVWGLSAANDDARRPIFFGGLRMKIIQATSPRRKNWKDWSKHALAKCYIMDIWSEEETADLARLLNLDVERMTFLAKEWGGVPRLLLKFLGENLSDSTIEGMYREPATEAR